MTDLKPVEDSHFINNTARLWGVFDGGSAAYSPSHPPYLYSGKFTGGQMAASIAAAIGMQPWHRDMPIGVSLGTMNEAIAQAQGNAGLIAGKDDVGGCCFAVAQATEEGINLRIGGDCGVFWTDDSGNHFLNGFDEAAEKVEADDEASFALFKEQAGGDLARAWDLYFSGYRRKRLTYINKKVGRGGFAILNGDPAVRDCLTTQELFWNKRPDTLLLMTDGCLPASMTAMSKREELVAALSNINRDLDGDQDALFAWRDEVVKGSPEAPHIVGHPEATYVRLQFDIGI
jgi:hypothetical protein